MKENIHIKVNHPVLVGARKSLSVTAAATGKS
jgi:hypothetical protein